MKNIAKYIVTVLLFFVAYSASAQKYSLYYTRTLYDGIQNPHHRSLDSCRSWATNFFLFPSLSLDARITGDANTFIKSFLASENLSDLTFEDGPDKNSEISNKFNYNLFMLKVRIGRKRDAEFSIYSQIKFETAVRVNNGLFNFVTKGNNAFKGQTINGFMDLGGLVNSYVETGFGFRRQIYKGLSGGFKVGYLVGTANATFDIKDTKFVTSATGDTVDITINGSVKSSIDPDKTDEIATNITKNTGIVFSGGLQYDLGKKLTFGVGLLDFGTINWNANSRQYTLGKTLRFTGVNAFADSAFQDSVIKDLSSFAIDSSYGAYSAPLLAKVEFSLNVRWANWYQNTIVVSKPMLSEDYDFTFISDLRLARRINLIALGTYNTSGYSSVGAQFLYRGKGLDFYFGSEKLLNTYQISEQVADHTKKPILGLGADFNFGIAFGFGRCPKKKVVAGPVDSDADGILDALDNCPFKAGPPENRGCPYSDTDLDGVLDKDDLCPTVAGPIDNAGCPFADADSDSIPDKDDLCPTDSGSVLSKGCPDYDRDSILDKDDLCPNVAGPVTNGGCPLSPQKVLLNSADQEIVNAAIKNLSFDLGKTVILESSFATLDSLAKLLLKKPSFKLLIEINLVEVGTVENNTIIAQSRADEVKKYLAAKTIDATRITAKGTGAEKTNDATTTTTTTTTDTTTTEVKPTLKAVDLTILEG